MSGSGFKPAVKSKAKLRLAFIGPAGSGKTYSALQVASGLGDSIAVLDTEHGSASLYSDKVAFDVMELETCSPANYVDAIHAAELGGYDVLIIDSLSHAWMGKGGALEMVDQAQARSKSGNSFAAWRDVTPEQQKMVEAILSAKLHIIVTMRSKTEYVVETVNGRAIPRKVGLAPVQRDGIEFEFDLVGDIDSSHRLVVSKSRIEPLADAVIEKPGVLLAHTLLDWLGNIKPAPVVAVAAVPPMPVPVSDSEKESVTGPQLRLMADLFKQAELTPAYWDKVRAEYGITSSRELTVAQAKEVIEDLESIIVSLAFSRGNKK